MLQEYQRHKLCATDYVLSLSVLCELFADFMFVEYWTGALQVQPRFEMRNNFTFGMLHSINILQDCPIDFVAELGPGYTCSILVLHYLQHGREVLCCLACARSSCGYTCDMFSCAGNRRLLANVAIITKSERYRCSWGRVLQHNR